MQILAPSMDKLAISERHDHVATPRDRQWGLHVVGTGRRVAPSHVRYQVREPDAPGPLQWARGRTLPCHGLVYLTAGRGEFSDRDRPRQRVQAGDVLLLFPHVWHNYGPDPETGWTEFWVLYEGLLADRWLRQRWLDPEQPVLHPGVHAELLQLFDELFASARAQPPYANQIQAGLTMQLVATVLSRVQRTGTPANDPKAKAVARAQEAIEERWNQPVDMAKLARSLGLSYRHFRRLFLQHTGVPPNQYLLNLRINRAKRLLEETLTIEEVAERTGFADPFYFSRLFRQKTGITPAKWRGQRVASPPDR